MAITLDNQIIQSLQLLTVQLSSTNWTPTKFSLKKRCTVCAVQNK